MNRRGFLQRIGAASAAVVAAGAAVGADHPDRFTYRGRHIVWSGWHRPPNQFVCVGTWLALAPNSGEYRYLTTTGSGLDHRAREMDVQDMTWMRGEWPSPSELALATDAERERVKQLACRRLLEAL